MRSGGRREPYQVDSLVFKCDAEKWKGMECMDKGYVKARLEVTRSVRGL